MRRPPLWAIALIATLVVRSLVAASRMEELELERYTGNLAWALLRGVALDPATLPIIPHLRGSFVFGVLAVPFVALLGPSLLALKCLAVLFGALGAALFTALVERGLGRPTAWFAALWFAAAPPALQMVDVLALGSHADTLPFIVMPLLILMGPRGGAPAPPSLRRSVAAGAAFGFGLFFSMQLWVAAPAVLAGWLLLDPAGWRSRRALGAALAAAPFVALIPLVTRSATLVNRPIESRFLPEGLGGALDKLGQVFTGDLVRSWLFHEHGGIALAYLLAAVLVVGAVAAALRALRPGAPPEAARRRRALAVFACLHVLALLGAYAISDFQLNLRATEDGMGSRYFMPLWPAFGIGACLALDELRTRFGSSAAIGFAALALVPGLLGARALIDPGRFGQQPPVSGLELYLFQNHLEHDAGEDPEALLALIERLDPDWPAMRTWCYAEHFPDADGPTHSGYPARIAALAAAEPGQLARLRAVHLGTLMMDSMLRNRRALKAGGDTLQDNLARAAAELPADLQPWLLRGAGMASTARQIEEARLGVKLAPEAAAELRATEAFQFVPLLAPALQRPYLEGMGFRLGLRTGPFEAIDKPVYRSLDDLTQPHLQVYLRAVGWGYRMRYREASYRPPGELLIHERLTERQRQWFDAGLREPVPHEEGPPGGPRGAVSPR